MLAHRDDPSARNSDQARRLCPLDQQGQAVQLGAALDREASIENVAGIQQFDQRERVHTSEPTGLRQRVAGADPVHESAYPGDRRRAGSDRREIVIRHAARPAWVSLKRMDGSLPGSALARAGDGAIVGACGSRSVLRRGHDARGDEWWMIVRLSRA